MAASAGGGGGTFATGFGTAGGGGTLGETAATGFAAAGIGGGGGTEGTAFLTVGGGGTGTRCRGGTNPGRATARGPTNGGATRTVLAFGTGF